MRRLDLEQRREGKLKQRRVPQAAWLRGSSSRNEIGAFDFRHNEFEDMVSFMMECECVVILGEYRIHRRCQTAAGIEATRLDPIP